MFNRAREDYLGGDLDWDLDDIRVMLVPSTYTFDATDVFVADLGVSDNGRSASLGSKTKTNGTADAADTSLTATAAVACNALIVFVHTGSDATAQLICRIGSATGLPFTPAASQNVPITWNASGIFTL